MEMNNKQTRQPSSSSHDPEVIWISDDEDNKKVEIKAGTSASSTVETAPIGDSQKPIKSFLASLTSSVPLIECHPLAKRFRDDYTKNKNELVRHLFDIYNESVFGNSIPENTPFEWNSRMVGTAGLCRKLTDETGGRRVQIRFSIKIVNSADRLRDILIHELCHAATWIVNNVSDGHGACWKSWADKAMKCFPELPAIKRCHEYALHYKYTYKCLSCGCGTGRHRKSIDIKKARCGHCRSKLVIINNKK